MTSAETTVSVREARNRFPEIVRRAAEGQSFTVTSHGRAQAVIRKADPAQVALRVDWPWLKAMRVKESCVPTEQRVRGERDGRD